MRTATMSPFSSSLPVLIGASGDAASTTTSSSSSAMPVLITASAAIVVALIAAITAQVRQRQQLAHDGARLAAELDSERTLKDLEELRGLLDDAARDLVRSERAILEIGFHRESQDVTRRLWDAGEGMWANSMRLRIRLGDDAIGTAYWEATLAVRDALYLVRDASFESKHRELLNRFLVSREGFFDAAYQKLKSRLPPPRDDRLDTHPNHGRDERLERAP